MAVAWALSEDRRAVPWRTVAWGIALQLGLGLLLLKTPFGDGFFAAMSALVDALIACTDEGVRFVFGALVDTGFSFAVNVLPTIVFMGSLFAVLYHVGVLQLVVRALSVVFARTMRISGAESLCAIANVFLGMVESALVVRPYLERMTRSELFSLMTLGMATVGGLGDARVRDDARRRRLRRPPRHGEPDLGAGGRADGEAHGARARDGP